MNVIQVHAWLCSAPNRIAKVSGAKGTREFCAGVPSGGVLEFNNPVTCFMIDNLIPHKGGNDGFSDCWVSIHKAKTGKEIARYGGTRRCWGWQTVL